MNLQPIREAFPDLKDEDGWLHGRPGYVELIASCGAEVIHEVVHGSYQGEGYVILKRGDEWGFVSYGYGSCSGCDSLEAARTIEDIDKERVSLIESIQWSNDPAKLLAIILATPDFSDDEWHVTDERTAFRKKAAELLTARNDARVEP